MHECIVAINVSHMYVFPCQFLNDTLWLGGCVLWYAVNNVRVVCFHAYRTLALWLGFLGVLEFLSNSSQNKSFSNICEGNGRHTRGECKIFSDDYEPPVSPFWLPIVPTCSCCGSAGYTSDRARRLVTQGTCHTYLCNVNRSYSSVTGPVCGNVTDSFK